MITINKLTIYSIYFSTIILFLLLFPLITNGQSTPPAFNNIKWQKGPCIGNLGDIAEVLVPDGYLFADSSGTRDFMEIIKELPSGHELGLVISFKDKYYTIFEFASTGYIRDDEKDSLDADAMLKSIKDGTEKANQEKRKKGWPIMTITGWEETPHYNQLTHNLEWAIRGESEGQPVINYNTRLLGRSGVMQITLVADPELLRSILPNYNKIIESHNFKPGHKYAEFRKGDQIAKYGLSALVAGGATAVAVKSGVFKWLWKLIVAAGIGLLALLKKLFGKKDN